MAMLTELLHVNISDFALQIHPVAAKEDFCGLSKHADVNQMLAKRME